MIKSPGKKPVLSIDDIQEHAVQLRMLGLNKNQTWNGMMYLLNTFVMDRITKNKDERQTEQVRLQLYADMVKYMFQLDLL